MNVYIVERCFDYEGCEIKAVYATRELAEAHAETLKRWETDDAPTVSEWTVSTDATTGNEQKGKER